MQLVSRICGRLSQRHVLVVLLLLSALFCTLNLLTFTLLLKSLIYKDKVEHHDSACPSAKDPRHNTTHGHEEFLWGTQLQVYILTAWNVGYALGRLPAGLIADRYGAKTLLGYSVFVPGVGSLLTPLCARTSPYLILANRIVMGMFCSAQYPALAWLAARWFPSRYMFRMLSVARLGLPLGFIARYYLTHEIEQNHHNWTTTYYLVGGLTIFFVYFWQALVYDDPFEHPYISLGELELLADKVTMYAHDMELEPGWSWPWKAILTSPSVWTLISAELGFYWFNTAVISIIPDIYLSEVHQYDFQSHAKFGSFLYLLNACVMVTAGVAADKLIEIRCYNMTHIAKIYYGVSAILGSVLLIGLVVQAQCRLTTAFIFYTGAMACMGVGKSVGIAAAVHIAPNMAATVYALATLPAQASLSLLYKLDNELTPHQSLSEWRTVSFLHAAIILLATAIFIKAGDCQVQPWNEPYKKRRLQVDYEGEAGPSDEPDSGRSLEERGHTSLRGGDSLTMAHRRAADQSAHSLVREASSSFIPRRRSDFQSISESRLGGSASRITTEGSASNQP